MGGRGSSSGKVSGRGASHKKSIGFHKRNGTFDITDKDRKEFARRMAEARKRKAQRERT